MCCTEKAPWLLIAAAMLLLPGCGEDAPRPAPEAAGRPAAAPAEVALEGTAPGIAPAVDAFGNLRGSGAKVLGFELPLNAEVQREVAGRPSRFYVQANEKRLLRYFRSRGHSIVETLSGWRVEHTDRTLREAAPGDGAEGAVLVAGKGPGPGWTLRLDTPEPTPLERPALLELVEAEGEVAGGDVKPAPPAGAPDLFQEPGGDGEASVKRGPPPATPDRVSGLRKRALKRELDPKRSRDISDRVYQHVQRNPGKPFLD